MGRDSRLIFDPDTDVIERRRSQPQAPLAFASALEVNGVWCSKCNKHRYSPCPTKEFFLTMSFTGIIVYPNFGADCKLKEHTWKT